MSVFIVAEGGVNLKQGGTQWVSIPVNAKAAAVGWHMLELKANPSVSWHARVYSYLRVFWRWWGSCAPMWCTSPMAAR